MKEEEQEGAIEDDQEHQGRGRRDKQKAMETRGVRQSRQEGGQAETKTRTRNTRH